MTDEQQSDADKVAAIGDKLTAWIRTQLEPCDELSVSNLSSPDIGYSSETLLFDLEYSVDKQRQVEPLVLRLEPQGIPLFSRYDLATQYRIMDTLRDSVVPVPKMRWFEADDSLFGAPFYVMEQIAGRVPADNPPYHMEGMLVDMTESERGALWNNALTAMARIHAMDVEKHDLGFLHEPELGDTPIAQHIQLYVNHIDWGLDRGRFLILDTALNWLRENMPRDEPVSLAWGDARVCNMIFQGTEVKAVLDWEMAHLGNPLQDLGFWLVLDYCMSEGLGIERLSGIPGEADAVALWEDVSGHSSEHLFYYKVFAAWRFTVIMARVITREKMLGNMPEDDRYDIDNLGSQALVKLLGEAGLNCSLD